MPGKKANKLCMLVHYTCKDQDGTVLETTRDGEPVQVIAGNEDVLPALEKHYIAMAPGESKVVTLKPNQAFGQVHGDLFFEVPTEMLQLGCQPELGMTVELTESDGEPFPGTIVEIYDDYVLVDANHPLAGKTLTFELTRIQ